MVWISVRMNHKIQDIVCHESFVKESSRKQETAVPSGTAVFLYNNYKVFFDVTDFTQNVITYFKKI